MARHLAALFVALAVGGAVGSLTLGQEAPTGPNEPAEGTSVDVPADSLAPEKSPAAVPAGTGKDLLDLMRASGGIGVVLVLLSVAAVALFFEHLATIRRGALMPEALVNDLHAQVSASDMSQAEQTCVDHPSYLAVVVLAGLREVRFGYAAVEKAMEDASGDQAARLFRKVEYLALIASIAPMLGLLGTVYGLVLAFKHVAESQGTASAADLADGIYLALITTVMGLIVAIPTLSAYAIFRIRVEQLASEANLLAERMFMNYKRSRLRRKHKSSNTQ